MYRLNDQQQSIVERASMIAEEVLLPHAGEVDEKETFPKESIQELAEEGFLGLTVPEEYGGWGEGIRTACAVLEELAQRCPSTSMIYFMHLSGIAAYLERPQTSEPYLREAAEGEHLTTLAWSEFGSRSHFWAPVSQEQVDGDTVTINAEKSWVTAGEYTDGYVVSTGWEDAETPADSMLYLVLDDDGHMQPGESWDLLGMRGNASIPMTIDDLEIPRDRALSDPGAGMEIMLEVVLPVFQLGSAAISTGIAEAATQITRDHLVGNKHEETESSLADLQNLRERLATMRIETDRSRAHLESVIHSVENSSPRTQLMVLESKAAASETARDVTERGMKACGGTAYGKGIPLERFFRDSRAASVMAPTTDVLRDFIGKSLCDMEVF